MTVALYGSISRRLFHFWTGAFEPLRVEHLTDYHKTVYDHTLLEAALPPCFLILFRVCP